MDQERETTHVVHLPPPGSSIRSGADAILYIMDQERKHSEARYAQLRQYHEEYRRLSENRQAEDARKLSDVHRSVTNLQGQYSSLYKSKVADENALHQLMTRVEDLEQERDFLRAELLTNTSESQPDAQSFQSPTLTAATLQSNLMQYNLLHMNLDSLCFNGLWLSLWNEVGMTDSSQPLTANDYFTPADVNVLLQNCLGCIRSDKETIQTLRERLIAAGGEDPFAYTPNSKQAELQMVVAQPEIQSMEYNQYMTPDNSHVVNIDGNSNADESEVQMMYGPVSNQEDQALDMGT